MPRTGLLPRQEEFCRQYLRCQCGAEAARRAGYRSDSARWTAYTLLRRADVRARIEALRAEADMADAGFRAFLIGHLEAARAMATDAGDAAAAVKALRMIDQLCAAPGAARDVLRETGIDAAAVRAPEETPAALVPEGPEEAALDRIAMRMLALMERGQEGLDAAGALADGLVGNADR